VTRACGGGGRHVAPVLITWTIFNCCLISPSLSHPTFVSFLAPAHPTPFCLFLSLKFALCLRWEWLGQRAREVGYIPPHPFRHWISSWTVTTFTSTPLTHSHTHTGHREEAPLPQHTPCQAFQVDELSGHCGFCTVLFLQGERIKNKTSL
jgi:hypothetical protein